MLSVEVCDLTHQSQSINAPLLTYRKLIGLDEKLHGVLMRKDLGSASQARRLLVLELA